LRIDIGGGAWRAADVVARAGVVTAAVGRTINMGPCGMAFGAGVGGGIGTLSVASAVELIIGLMLFDGSSSGGGRFFSFFDFFAGRVGMETFCLIHSSTRASS